MAVLSRRGVAALQRAKDLHPAAGSRGALTFVAAPMTPAAAAGEAEPLGDAGRVEETSKAGAPRLMLVADRSWRPDGGAA